jgi:hypothetical protein
MVFRFSFLPAMVPGILEGKMHNSWFMDCSWEMQTVRRETRLVAKVFDVVSPRFYFS